MADDGGWDSVADGGVGLDNGAGVYTVLGNRGDGMGGSDVFDDGGCYVSLGYYGGSVGDGGNDRVAAVATVAAVSAIAAVAAVAAVATIAGVAAQEMTSSGQTQEAEDSKDLENSICFLE